MVASSRPLTSGIAAVVGAALLVAAPRGAAAETIAWERAAAHAGRRVTVEGVVWNITCTESTCTLIFASDDPAAFTATIVRPLVAWKPVDPVTAYRGRRVQLTGVVHVVEGRPEMILRGTRAVRIVDSESPAGHAPEGAATSLPTGHHEASGPSKDAPQPGAAPAAAATEPAIAARTPAAACEAERRRWQDLAPRLDAALEAVTLCTRGEAPRCGSETKRLAAILREVEVVEDALATTCP